MSVVSNNILAGASGQGGAGYEIERSLRFNSGDSAYLNRTPSAAGNRQTWTWSGWFKRSELAASNTYNALWSTGTSGTNYSTIYIDNNDRILLQEYTGSTSFEFLTDRVFRDPSAWYHLVVSFDSTQATDTNRIKFYINGAQIDSFGTRINPSQNYESMFNLTNGHSIARNHAYNNFFFGGYLADVHFIDGQALAATDFGETDDNGVWQPKAYTGNYNISNITYSNYLSAPGGFASGEGATNAFDGSTSTRTKVAVADSIITFDLSSLNLTGSFEFYATNAASEYSLDGGTTWTSSAANSYTTATSDISGVSNIKLKSESGTTMKVTAFKNQGFVLVDNSGTNSFHLDFADNSSNAALGTDTSGNSNDWTVNNLIAGRESVSTDTIASVNTPTFAATATSVPGFALQNTPNDFIDSSKTTYYNSAGVRVNFSLPVSGVFSFTSGGALTPSNTMSLYDSSDNLISSFGGVTTSNWQNGITLTSPAFVSNVSYIVTSTSATGVGSDGCTWHYMEVNGQMVTSSFTTGTLLTFPTDNNFDKLQVGDVVQTGVSITAINAAGPTIVTDGGTWLGSDASGTSGGDTVLSTTAVTNGDNLVDTPTNGTQTDTGAGGEVVGNYATLNPLSIKANQGTMENGNLRISATNNYYIEGRSTIAASSFDNYSELTISSVSSNPSMGFAVGDKDTWIITGGGTYLVYREGGTITRYPGNTTVDTVASYTQGDVLGMAVDNTNVKFYKNGSLQGTYAHQLTGEYFVTAMSINGNVSGQYTTLDVNFGQRAFAYTAPSGYKALCTANLEPPAIADGSKYFDTKLWTGNGSTQSITGYNFSPDFVWYKSRSSSSNSHGLFDIVRGTTKQLYSNNSNQEATYSGVTAFNSDGFDLGSDNGGNENSQTYVGWAWDGGSSTTTIAAGGLNSSVYDQSQNWAANTIYSETTSTGTIYSMWDGDTSTRNGSNAAASYETTFSPTLSGTVRVYAYSSGQRFRVNDGLASEETITTTGSGWHSFSTNFTSISTVGFVSTAGVGYATYAWEIGGKIMIDPSISVTNVPSVASTVRANPSAGFSIVTYTGTGSAGTIGHGLNAAPEFLIVKNRTSAGSWFVYHKSIGATKYLKLETTDAEATGALWSNTEPTSSVVSSSGSSTGSSGQDYLMLAFAPVEGYSAFGTYEGNGSTDGTFVYTGFKPQFVLIKCIDSGQHWHLFDSARGEAMLAPNIPNKETDFGVSDRIDFVSNGFKMRIASAINNNNETHIYMAFAEHPFKTARAR